MTDNHQSLCDDNSSVIPRPSTQIHSFLVGHPESVPRSSYFGVQDPFYEMSERKPAGESDCESGVDNKEEIQGNLISLREDDDH